MRTRITSITMPVITLCLSLAAACCLYAGDVANAAAVERNKSEQLVTHQRGSHRMYSHLFRVEICLSLT